MGILNPWNLKLILEQAQVPVIVDAGVGTASDATVAMDMPRKYYAATPSSPTEGLLPSVTR